MPLIGYPLLRGTGVPPVFVRATGQRPVPLPIQAGASFAVSDLTRMTRRPMTSLYRSMLNRAGGHAEKIGDSADKLDAIFNALA